VISIFFAVSAGISIILVIPDILNYVEFYKVSENFEITLENVTLNDSKIKEGKVFVNVKFNITNPTGFVGLKVSSVTCHMKYIKDGVPRSLAGTTRAFSPPTQVNPSQSVMVNVDFDLKYKGYEIPIRDFIGYLQKNPEKIDWIITGQFVLLAYTNSFAVQIGPFGHSTYLR